MVNLSNLPHTQKGMLPFVLNHAISKLCLQSLSKLCIYNAWGLYGRMLPHVAWIDFLLQCFRTMALHESNTVSVGAGLIGCILTTKIILISIAIQKPFFGLVSTQAKNRIANNREPIAVRACACGIRSRSALNKQNTAPHFLAVHVSCWQCIVGL